MASSSNRQKRQRLAAGGRRRVVWDEDNLAHLEETKSPKQRITEPKTPYRTLSLDTDEERTISPAQLSGGSDAEPKQGLHPEQVRNAISQAAAATAAAAGGSGVGPTVRRRGGGGGWTSSEDEGDAGEFEKWMEDRATAAAAAAASGSGDAAGSSSVTFQGPEDYYDSSRSEMSDKEFKEMRRRHYDEFRKLKALRATGRKLGEEEEGEEEGGVQGRGKEEMDVDADGQGQASMQLDGMQERRQQQEQQQQPGEQEYDGGAESDGGGTLRASSDVGKKPDRHRLSRHKGHEGSKDALPEGSGGAADSEGS